MSTPGRVNEFNGIAGTKSALLSNFDVGSSSLKIEHKKWLDTVLSNLLRTRGSVTLLGLTSSTGTEVYNLQLSGDRAKAVIAYIEKQANKQFPVKFEGPQGLGEFPARLFGLPNGAENSYWRAVLVSAWAQPIPPPIPTSEPPQVCRRTVVASGIGVNYWAVVADGSDKGRLVEQDIRVVPHLDYLRCTSEFERTKSFIVGQGSPVVEGYRGVYRGIVGVCVGHYLTGVSRHDMVVDRALARRMLGDRYDILLPTIGLEGFLKGVYFESRGTFVDYDKPHHTPIMPLYVFFKENRSQVRVDNTSEGRKSYDVVTDTEGKIVGILRSHGSTYPISESNFEVGTDEGVKKLVFKVIKQTLRVP